MNNFNQQLEHQGVFLWKRYQFAHYLSSTDSSRTDKSVEPAKSLRNAPSMQIWSNTHRVHLLLDAEEYSNKVVLLLTYPLNSKGAWRKELKIATATSAHSFLLSKNSYSAILQTLRISSNGIWISCNLILHDSVLVFSSVLMSETVIRQLSICEINVSIISHNENTINKRNI